MINVANIHCTRKTAMIIRHADRGEVPAGQVECPLNEQGELHAFELGTKLKGFKNYKFFSSPVDRCRQTSACIQKGLSGVSREEDISLSNVLGKPGPFVTDHKNNAFLEMGGYKAVEKQIAHEPLTGIRPIKEGTKIFMDFVLSEMGKAEEGSLLVFVTHDAIVGPVEYELTGEKFNEEHWPEFADGFFIEETDENMKVIRNGQYFDLRKF